MRREWTGSSDGKQRARAARLRCNCEHMNVFMKELSYSCATPPLVQWLSLMLSVLASQTARAVVPSGLRSASVSRPTHRLARSPTVTDSAVRTCKCNKRPGDDGAGARVAHRCPSAPVGIPSPTAMKFDYSHDETILRTVSSSIGSLMAMPSV